MFRALLFALALAGPAGADSVEVAVNFPGGQLQGTLERPEGAARAAALILPGSGPTDRNGNQGSALQTDTYRHLTEALADAGIAALRIDKRGVGSSSGDGNAVSLGLYRQDTAAWMTALATATGAPCVWLIGHSEGGILALEAATLPNVCGLVLLATPGRPLGAVVLEQMAGQPQFADQIAPMRRVLDQVAAGEAPDTEALAPPLAALFTGPASGYFMELLRTDPAALAEGTDLPILLIDGDADLQVTLGEGDRLAGANPAIERHTLTGMTHVLKQAEGDDMAANLATYADPTLPLHPDLAPLIVDFVTGGGR